ncbi:unnamed protein product [Caenorhabditis bovis]|uniref:KCTD8/12/16 H1 domain-containing protein n=1 Tax=Caenorhabditis bovis TaxID=2654633 RepID=A0A8S1EU19_9PELO|nr:unnamed protein product [Caenorhabditis bovis]
MHDNLTKVICAQGATITTTKKTLQRAPNSLLATSPEATADSDESIIRILIEALRREDFSIIVSESFDQWARLSVEAKRLGLVSIVESACPSTISISCHSALSTGRINPEVTFRKVLRIVVAGKVIMCRAVFGDSLNECRDSGGTDFEHDRYTSRFFLKHSNLEKAFDQLASAGYRLIHSNTFAPSQMPTHLSKDDSQFVHHSQYLFHRQPKSQGLGKIHPKNKQIFGSELE